MFSDIDFLFRVVARELRFDAGIISLELERVGLGHLVEPWADAVRRGFCTTWTLALALGPCRLAVHLV